ncbi:hypothetical protein [Treponema pedis]|uniref:hypothetical protein n=1 Tax=Treponema pedis TaxID=409322 RepID=UPI000400B3FA|nr:hypothetical protein [Treponema pedis]
MKQKKFISVVGVLILMICTVMSVTGCGKKSSKYMGSYSGKYTEKESHGLRNWVGSVDKDGNFKVSLLDLSDKVTQTLDLKVSKDGAVSGNIKISDKNVTITGTIDKAYKVLCTGTVGGQEVLRFMGAKK